PTRASVTPPVQFREGEANGDKYMFAYPRGAERLEVASIGIRCVKCPNHVIPLSPCPNCGGAIFMLSTDVLNFTGLSCLGCRKGFTSLKCVCGCQNPIQADTIMRLKAKSGGCFIATAACGDPFAPEVIALSAFRDGVLLRSRVGRAFVYLYYRLSPPVAATVARFNLVRRLALTLVVRPAVVLVGAMQKEPKPGFTAVNVQPKRRNRV
ncbi:MAG: CFI-box-CTERM domain-containing protein, partial [Thermoguttaceae bacterium]